MSVFLSDSREATEAFAAGYAKTLSAGDVVLLDGEMGAGKTVFAKGVAKGLGIEEEVTSPTYAYMNDYDGKLFHYDCYRIESPEQAEALGLADYFDMGGICLVAGLGGANRRPGTYDYYMSEPVVKDDAKGVGPFLLAYTEMLRLKK